jgi:Skp family chaperone for outer membrane proteins
MLLQRANDRLQNAIQKVAGRHAFDLVMERGSLVLKADQSEVMIADITNEVVFEVSR